METDSSTATGVVREALARYYERGVRFACIERWDDGKLVVHVKAPIPIPVARLLELLSGLAAIIVQVGADVPTGGAVIEWSCATCGARSVDTGVARGDLGATVEDQHYLGSVDGALGDCGERTGVIRARRTAIQAVGTLDVDISFPEFVAVMAHGADHQLRSPLERELFRAVVAAVLGGAPEIAFHGMPLVLRRVGGETQVFGPDGFRWLIVAAEPLSDEGKPRVWVSRVDVTLTDPYGMYELAGFLRSLPGALDPGRTHADVIARLRDAGWVAGDPPLLTDRGKALLAFLAHCVTSALR